MEKLLNCPFCGASEDALSFDGNNINQEVYCNGCDASGPLAQVPASECVMPMDPAKTERARMLAAERWNHRAMSPEAQRHSAFVSGYFTDRAYVEEFARRHGLELRPKKTDSEP